MPIRSGVCGKSRAGSDFVVARICGLFVREDYCWRSEDRRYEGQRNGARGAKRETAATNSTPRSWQRFSASCFNLTEVKNEKLQH
jgi:hypothetical protein